MNVRIDGIRLLKVFAWYEAVLVGIPMLLYVLGYAVAELAAPGPAAVSIVLLFCVALFVGSFYLLLPGLIAPDLIRCGSPLPVLLPQGLAGWFVVIGVYSAMALFFAFWASLYTVNKGRSLRVVSRSSVPLRDGK